MPRKRPPSTIEIGLGGLKQYAGRVDEEWHPKLKGRRASAVFEEMRDNDPVVGAVLYSVEAYLRQVKWSVKAKDDSEASQKEAEFLTSCMKDMEMSWEDFISDILSFLVYGFSVHETVYKVRLGSKETNPRYRSESDDGRFGWRGHFLRPQTTIDSWDLNENTGEIYGINQLTVTGGSAYLPINRCLHFRTRTFKNNPEGRSILRNAYRAWYFKKRLEEIEAIGASRDLSGMPVVEMPPAFMNPDATAAQKRVRASMESLVSQIHHDSREGIVFPSEFDSDNKPTGYKLKLLSSPGGKQVPADPIIRRYDTRILMSMAAEFLALGTEKQGSFALGAEKSGNFLRSLTWYIKTIEATLNKTAVARLFDVNNVPAENRAYICAGDIDLPDLGSLGTFLQQAASNGFLHPTPAIEEKLRELAHLPIEADSLEELFAEAEKKAEEAAAAATAALQAGPADPEAPKKPAPKEPTDE